MTYPTALLIPAALVGAAFAYWLLELALLSLLPTQPKSDKDADR